MNPATPPCVGARPRAWRAGVRPHQLGWSDLGVSRVVCRVLAPPEAPGKKPRSSEVTQPPTSAVSSGDFWSSTTSFASQLLSHFKLPAFAAPSPDAVLREASTKERELQRVKAPVDISHFLSPVGVWELKLMRKLSSLTALTYYMHLVTPRRLRMMHGLELVTTSRACDIRPYEHNKTAEEVGADGDGMAVSMSEARQVYQALKRADSVSGDGIGGAGAGRGSSNIVTLTRELPYQVLAETPASAASGSPGGPSWPIPAALTGELPPQQQQQQQVAASGATGGAAGAGSGASAAAAQGISAPSGLPRMLRTPAEAVALKLTEAAVAASAAAAANPLTSSLYAGLVSLPIGNALVGSNNRVSNTLLQPPPPSSSSSPSSSPSTSSSAGAADSRREPSAAAAAASASASGAAAAATDSAGFLGGRQKATAAAIAALTTERLRQQALAGFMGTGRGSNGGVGAATATAAPASNAAAGASTSNGNGGAVSGGISAAGGGGGGGGMAPINASGLLTSSPPPAAAVLAAGAAGAASGGGGGSAAATGAAALAVSASAAAVSQFLCPSEWFVVDDPASNTRIFVIQGSDTLDHWKLNLTFDPVVFEEPSLGVKVHRGAYEAALVLYDRFLPLVYEHLESSPFSKVTFTGHSIGGSLATLLMLMYRIRGVLPPHSIAPVYTFGSPSVFCQTQQPPASQQGVNGHANGHAKGHSNGHLNGHANGHANGHVHNHNHNGHHHHNGHNGHHQDHTHPHGVNGHNGHHNGHNGNGHARHGHGHNGKSGSHHHHHNGHHNGHYNDLDNGHNHQHQQGHRGGLRGAGSSSKGAMGSMEDYSAPAAAPPAAPLPSVPATPTPSTCVSSPYSAGSSYCSCSSDDLLARLQLPPSVVRNVLMARDVVPRAFACDYSPVADILRSWGASFKEHCCLGRNGRKHLYYFIGRMCVLQPDGSWLTFVGSDPDHPMLPPGPGLYYLVDQPTAPYSTAVATAAAPPAAAVPLRPVAGSVMEAVWEFMDCPHPLETLADPGAYLASGIISRFHNPEHYTRALGRIKHLIREAEGRHSGVGGAGAANQRRRRQAAAAGAVAAADSASVVPRLTARQGGGGGGRFRVVAGTGLDSDLDLDLGLDSDLDGQVPPWDSSDGLDLDLWSGGGGGEGVVRAVSYPARDTRAHACR